ncbi:ABC transporter permease [Desulfonatronovibrio magnus]|uniref:ABC transporter permease n=1 Tax=Desulfonatronovibrio magnus TaxID=698827 RepID=UPI0005EBDB44|nr:ABC transporter permease [Desulfonatronovibrio magnus]
MIERILLPLLMVFRYNNLLRSFVSREIRGRFAGNIAGIAWTLITPVATMLVYMFVFSIVLRISVTVEETGTDSFFVYFVTGFVPWLIFADSMSKATGSILDNASIVTKVIFPVELLPLTSVVSSLIINGFGLAVLLIFLASQGFISSTWVLLFLILPLQTLFTMGVGMLFASACVYLRDIREMTGLILMVWFFSTPIIYPLSMVPENIQSLILLNPMHAFISLYRDVLIADNLEVLSIVIVVLYAVLAYIVGSLFFARVKPGFGDVL